jgi:DNA-binding PadR family transcriptional regulator
MSIQCAILGFLSWKPLTGYELKKLFVDSATLHWSGNNNQIYKTLIELHKNGLVTQDIQPQADHPTRKIYTITDAGLAELRKWVLATPELPQIRHTFLVQLAWADVLDADELDALVANYQEEVHTHWLMLQAQAQRKTNAPERTPREAYLWDMLMKNSISLYENELNWVRQLRRELRDMERNGHGIGHTD